MTERRFAVTNDPELAVPHVYNARANWSSPPPNSILVENNTKRMFMNIGTAAAPVWREVSFLEAWRAQEGNNAIFATYSDGDPRMGARMQSMKEVSGPTNAQVSGTAGAIARGTRFYLPRRLALGSVRAFPVAASAGNLIHRFAIYNDTTAELVWDSGFFATTADTWLSLVGTEGVVLNPNTPYWFFWTPNSTSATAYWQTPGAPPAPSFFGAEAAPLGGRGLAIPEYGQIALSAGVFPDVMPALAAAAWGGGTTGTLPIAFLIGTAS